jgi:hypothetical protein
MLAQTQRPLKGESRPRPLGTLHAGTTTPRLPLVAHPSWGCCNGTGGGAWLVRAVAAAIVALMGGCSTNLGFADSDESVGCPSSCQESVVWDSTKFGQSSYGELSTGSGWTDSYAYKILDACQGWSVFEGHKGGTGDTLQIASCNNGVVLVWAYNSFSSVKLSQGWTGTTSTGMAIGASYQDFIGTYPGYTSDSTLLDATGSAVLNFKTGFAYFTNGVLSALVVY